jgi:1-acyl-sn-glycerol-3-phosphate acyltransferase
MAEPNGTPDSDARAVERVALAVCRYVNERPGPKEVQRRYHRAVGDRIVRASIGRRVQVHGIEHAADLAPDRGVLLVSNHRSFFDQYVLMSVLYNQTRWPRRVYFPVRSNYFYEAWSGLVLNGLIGGFVMYPPIFRAGSRAAENRGALERLADLLRDPGDLVGMHPEGTRGKGSDPYALLPAQPGIGQLVMRARPIVLPAFVNGIGNDFASEVLDNLRRPGARPIHVVFGAPVAFGELLEGSPRPAQYKRVADHVLSRIAALGEIERGLRAPGR